MGFMQILCEVCHKLSYSFKLVSIRENEIIIYLIKLELEV